MMHAAICTIVGRPWAALHRLSSAGHAVARCPAWPIGPPAGPRPVYPAYVLRAGIDADRATGRAAGHCE